MNRYGCRKRAQRFDERTAHLASSYISYPDHHRFDVPSSEVDWLCAGGSKTPIDDAVTPARWTEKHLSSETTELTCISKTRLGRACRYLFRRSAPSTDLYCEYTPRTLSEMIAEHRRMSVQEPEKTKTSKLFSLPRELRDMIYRYALVPSTPIDFGALIGVGPHNSTVNRRRKDAVDPFAFHLKQLTVDYHPTLLRVCRQTLCEAAPIYYGQPFRFTQSTSWATLFLWLRKIGERNRRYVKDLTVCHPALVESDTKRHPAVKVHTSEGDLSAATCLHQGGNDTLLSLIRFDDSMSKDLTRYQDWPGWQRTLNVAFMLAAMQNLRKVELLVKRDEMHQYHEKTASGRVKTLQTHPIHDYLRSHLPDTQLSIVNFIPALNLVRRSFKPQEVVPRGEDGYSLEYTLNENADRDFPDNKGARELFRHVETIGWKVVETYYDVKGNYPVAKGVFCGNPEMVDYLYAHPA